MPSSRGQLERHGRRLVHDGALLADADVVGIRAVTSAEDLVARRELSDVLAHGFHGPRVIDT